MNDMLHTPDLSVTLITDVSMAWEMADAANPGYEALCNGGRDLTINRAAAIGMEIGAAMEVARHNYLADTVGSAAVEQSTEITPAVEVIPAKEPTLTYDPAEATQMLVEQNIGMLDQTISSIFTTLRQMDGSLAFGRTNTQPLDGVPTTFESITMYDPETRTIAYVYQQSHAAHGVLEMYEQAIDEIIPVDGTEVTKKGLKGKAQGRTLGPGQSIRLRAGKRTLLHPIHDTTIDTDPADLSALLTRLTRSFPLSDPHCVLAKDSTGRGQRESLLDKELVNKLNEDQQRYRKLQEVVPSEPLLNV